MLHLTQQNIFWKRCQQGLPVQFRNSPATNYPGLHLGLPPGQSEERELVYARIDRPTARLLLHFLRTPASDKLNRSTLTIGPNCRLSPTVARLLRLGSQRVIIRPGNYPVLIDDRFLTVSVALIRQPERCTA